MKRFLLFLPAFFFPGVARAFEFAIIPSTLYPKFQNGDLEWADIIAFGLHIIQLLISAAGVFAVILLMIGGFQIIFGATIDDQDSGKQTIKNTLIGFAVILSAWIAVDFLISFLTSAQ